MSENVVLLGASDNPERYSYLAMKMLAEYGHRVFLINPGRDSIEGQPCYKSLDEITAPIDTVSIYVNPKILADHIEAILRARPKRVIFNPGTEDRGHQQTLAGTGGQIIEACTLVLLRTGQFQTREDPGFDKQAESPPAAHG